jgi:hypothetical protein
MGRKSLALFSLLAIVVLRGDACGRTTTGPTCASRASNTIAMGLAPGYCQPLLDPCQDQNPQPLLSSEWSVSIQSALPTFLQPAVDDLAQHVVGARPVTPPPLGGGGGTATATIPVRTEGEVLLCTTPEAAAHVGEVVNVTIAVASRSTPPTQRTLNVALTILGTYDQGWSVRVTTQDPHVYSGNRILEQQSATFSAEIDGLSGTAAITWAAQSADGGSSLQLAPDATGANVTVVGPAGSYLLSATAKSADGQLRTASTPLQITKGPIASFTWDPASMIYYQEGVLLTDHSVGVGALSYSWSVRALDGKGGATQLQAMELCSENVPPSTDVFYFCDFQQMHVASISEAVEPTYVVTLTVSSMDSPPQTDTSSVTLHVIGF